MKRKKRHSHLNDKQIGIEDLRVNDEIDLVDAMEIKSGYQLDANKHVEKKASDASAANSSPVIASDNEVKAAMKEQQDVATDESEKNIEISDSIEWLKKHQRLVTTCAAILCLVAIMILVVDQILRPDVFQVKSVKIVAPFEKAERTKIRSTLENYVGKNYFSVELNEVQNTVKKIPWVKQVEARREWPAKLVVTVDEYEAKAQWNSEYLIDISKDVFAKPESNVPDNLVVLNGPDGKHELVFDDFNHWFKTFQRKGYVITEMSLSNRYTYDMTLSLSEALLKYLQKDKMQQVITDGSNSDVVTNSSENNLIIEKIIHLKIGNKDNAEKRIARFLDIVNPIIEKNMLYVENIDLRYEQGFSIKWVDDKQPESLIAQN